MVASPSTFPDHLTCTMESREVRQARVVAFGCQRFISFAHPGIEVISSPPLPACPRDLF